MLLVFFLHISVQTTEVHHQFLDSFTLCFSCTHSNDIAKYRKSVLSLWVFAGFFCKVWAYKDMSNAVAQFSFLFCFILVSVSLQGYREQFDCMAQVHPKGSKPRTKFLHNVAIFREIFVILVRLDDFFFFNSETWLVYSVRFSIWISFMLQLLIINM